MGEEPRTLGVCHPSWQVFREKMYMCLLLRLHVSYARRLVRLARGVVYGGLKCLCSLYRVENGKSYRSIEVYVFLRFVCYVHAWSLVDNAHGAANIPVVQGGGCVQRHDHGTVEHRSLPGSSSKLGHASKTPIFFQTRTCSTPKLEAEPHATAESNLTIFRRIWRC